MALTISRMRGAVRYFVLNSDRRFSVSLAILWARSTGTFASLTRASTILFLSNSSMARREVRTSIFLLLKKRSSMSSVKPMMVRPRSVRRYSFVSTSGSMRSAFRRYFRW